MGSRFSQGDYVPPRLSAGRRLVRVSLTVGCWIASLSPLIHAQQSRQDQPTTFNRDVAPIVYRHCSGCHHPAGPAPFSLLDYKDVRRRGSQIADVTRSRLMPPWQPAPGYVQYVGQRGLTPSQIETIGAWVAGGMLEGDADRRPTPPRFASGWQLGEPDLVVTLPSAYTLAADGTDVIRNFVIEPPVLRSRYVRAVEIDPGNPRAVHHAIMKIDRSSVSRRRDALDSEPGFPGMEMGAAESPDGHTVVWAPGSRPDPGIEGLAWGVAPGVDVVLQLHMVPTGKPEAVQPRIAFHFTDSPPTRQPIELMLQGRRIDIPAGAKQHLVEDSLRLPVPVRALAIFPHAHYLGKQIQVYAELPDSERRWLVRIDDWDFNWQDRYRFVEPPELPAGTTLVMRYTYDNSADNLQNPNFPPVRVVGGNRSVDEMATVSIQVLTPSAEDRVRLQVAQFEQLLARDPGDAIAHYNLAVTYATVGELQRAVPHYEQALTLAPGDPATHYYAGNAYFRLSQMEQASRHYERALELRPEFAEVHYVLSLVRENQQRLGDAIRHLERVVSIDPDFVQAHSRLGRLLHLFGRSAEAQAHLERALELQPDLTEARELLERLQRSDPGTSEP